MMIKLPFIHEKIDNGSTILEHYEVKETVSNGYICKREGYDGNYLLRPITADLEKQDALELKQNAEQLSEKLIHQNIAHLLLTAKDEKTDVFFNVVQTISGAKLNHWAAGKRENGVLSVATMIPILRQIADALDYAGRKGIHHPALKPDSIWISPQGEVMIHDFDLLVMPSNRRQQYLRVSPELAWPVSYMPPEACKGEPLTAYSNQYTLAAIVYELLAGQPPLYTEDISVLREAIINDQPKRISQLADAQNDTLIKALAKQPEERYTSCNDFVNALETVATAVQQSPAPAHEPMKPFFSNRLNIVLTVILAAFALLIFKISLDQIQSSPARSQKKEEVSQKTQGKTIVAGKATEETTLLDKEKQLVETKRLEEIRKTEENQKAAEEAKRIEEVRKAEAAKKVADEAKRIEEVRKAEAAKKAAEEAKRIEEARKAEEAKKAEEARKAAEEAKRIEEAKKAEAARKAAEEAKKAAEEAKRIEEAKRLEEANKAEEARKAAEAKKAAEEAKRIEEAKKAAEEAKRIEEAKRLEAIKKAEEARKAAEAKKVAEEAKRLEEIRKTEEKARKKELLHTPFYASKYLFAKDMQYFPEIFEMARLEVLDKLNADINQAATDKQWHQVKELAIQMRAYDQARARHWQNTAEKQLAPSVHVTTWLDGREVSAKFLNQEQKMTPLHLTGLVSGATYSGDLVYERNGEKFTGKINFKVDWKGEQEYRVILKSTLPSKELPLPGAPSISLVEITAGEFIMGEDNISSDELRHVVVLTQNFWIGKYEITQKQWQAVMENNPSNFKYDDNPVEGITWNEAMTFCEKLNTIAASAIPEGFKVSLPTEAQWEFAARGGKQTRHYPYSGSDIIDDVAWHSENSNVRTQAVGMKFPNELGLYDMTGNVWEWCLDACEWESKVLTDTYRDGIVDPLSTKGKLHIIRGGGWLSSPKNCRIANRLCCDTNFKIYNLGLRIVLVPKK